MRQSLWIGLVLCSVALHASAQRYRLEPLSPDETYAAGSALNEAGQVVGGVTRTLPEGRLTLPAILGDLGAQVLRPQGTRQFVSGYATGVNEAGMIVGRYQDGLRTMPFVSMDGTSFEGLATPFDHPAEAVGVNASGQVANTLRPPFEGPTRAALWRLGNWTLLDLPDGIAYTEATGINDAGMVSGIAIVGLGSTQAVRWVGGVPQVMQGLVPGTGHRALAINRAGVMVGDAVAASGFPFVHAVVFRNGRAQDLDPRPRAVSAAYDINDRGWVVGGALVGARSQAFVVPPGGRMRSLEALLVPEQQGQWTIQNAAAINNAGVIAAYGQRAGDSSLTLRAFRLVPVDGP